MTRWEKLMFFGGTVMAAVFVAVPLAYLATAYSTASQQKVVRGKFVDLAVDILQTQPTPETEPLRSWATKILEQYSGVSMNSATKKGLIREAPLPTRSTSPSATGHGDQQQPLNR